MDARMSAPAHSKRKRVWGASRSVAWWDGAWRRASRNLPCRHNPF